MFKPENKAMFLFDQVEVNARLFPDHLAVVEDKNQISYRDAFIRASKIANYLTANGIGPESIVGICLPRSIELIVSQIGVNKSGAAFLPMDQDNPLARIELVLKTSFAKCLITTVTGQPLRGRL